MSTAAPPVDAVFRALADPTRCAVVGRLCQSPAAVSELAEPFAMALPSFMQHLRVLESCGLVASTKVGRVRTYRLCGEHLRAAEDWLSAQRIEWEARLDRFAHYVQEPEAHS